MITKATGVCLLAGLCSVPAILSAQAVSVTGYPTTGTATEITAGPDGALWFTESASNKIGRITTAGTITEYPLPTQNAGPQGIAAGPDGALWFTESFINKIGRITTAGAITEYPLPPPQGLAPFSLGDITAGPDGALWFTMFNSLTPLIGRITTTGAFTQFNIPISESGSEGITAGPDGALWITQSQSAALGGDRPQILRITTAGTITKYPLPSTSGQPQGITAGPDGALWFTEGTVGTSPIVPVAKIGRITTTGTVTEYPLSNTLARPWGITAGPDGALWFIESGSNGNGNIGRITTTGTITEYAISTSTNNPGGNPAFSPLTSIATGSDGALWFAPASTGVGRALLISPPIVTAVANAASNVLGAVAPGEIVTLYGSGLGPTQLTTGGLNSSGLVQTQVAGTQVLFNGTPAPIIYTWSPAVSAIVPYEISGTTAQVTVTYQGQTSPALTVPVAPSAPGIFVWELLSSGKGQALAANQDGSINSIDTPARVGSVITLYATGEGQTAPTGTDGKIAAAPAPQPVLPVTVTIGGQTIKPQYAGGAPSEVAGVMQINVQIPSGVQPPPGNAVPISVQVGTASSQPGVTIIVTGN